MKGISGPSFDVWLRSARLQSSLESRLRVALDVNGSPEYSLTWKHWAMPSREPICALRASVLRISGQDFGGWATPEARMYRDLSKKGVVYAATKQRHSLSTVCQAYIRGYGYLQIPFLISRMMGYPDPWVWCGASAMPSSRRSGLSS